METPTFSKRTRRKRPLLAQDDANDNRHKDQSKTLNSIVLGESSRNLLKRSAAGPDILQIQTELALGLDETEDSPSKHKSAPFSPSFVREPFRQKWKKMILLCLMLRCLWYFRMLHSRVLTSLSQGTYTGTSSLRTKQLFPERTEELLNDRFSNATSTRQRQSRITPNLQVMDGSIVNEKLISLPTIVMDLDPVEHNWRQLCQNAGLNETSRVIITNPFAPDSPACALAMLLHHQCRVTDIQLIDPLLPEDPSSRASVIRQYLAPLQKSIPTLQPLILSTVGKANNWFLHSHHEDVFTLPAPTHVIHFPATIFATEKNKLDFLLSESNFRLLSYRTATLQMEEFLARVLLQSSSTAYLQISFPSSIGKNNSQTFELSQQLSSVLYRYSTSLRTTISRNQLILLPTYGPGVFTTSNKIPSDSLYIEDALAALLMALRPSKQPVQYTLSHSVEVPPQHIPTLSWIPNLSNALYVNETRLFQSLAWLSEGETRFQNHVYLNPNTAAQLDDAALRNDNLFGRRKPSFPCVSSCNSPYFLSRCQPSVWDDVAPVSRRATENCSHVIYRVNLDPQMSSLPEIPDRVPQLCRLAFVSVSAPIVNAAIQQAKTILPKDLSWNEIVRTMNGEIDYFGWTMIWLSPPNLQISDSAITMIDPKGLFADHIAKAMYVGNPNLAASSDNALYRILNSVDRPASSGDRIKETRRGVAGFRWIQTDPYKARKTVFFVGGVDRKYIPENVSDFTDMVSVPIPQHQLSFYEQVVELSRHEEENSMKLQEFEFGWVALSVFVHDLQLNEAQAFRCEWFDEYLSWGDNRNAEELSLAFLLGLKRIEGSLGAENEKSWFPFLRTEDSASLVTQQDEEVFLRILSQ